MQKIFEEGSVRGSPKHKDDFSQIFSKTLHLYNIIAIFNKYST